MIRTAREPQLHRFSLPGRHRIRRPAAARAPRWAARFETLEARCLLTAYVVNTLDDTNAADGLLSLREAITAANTNQPFVDAPAGQAGPNVADSITFAPSLAGQTIVLSGGPLTLSDRLNLTGPSGAALTLNAAGSGRLFTVASGAGMVSLSRITLTGGSTAQSGGAVAVSNGQQLSLDSVTISGNRATDGGGIFNDGGTVEIANSTIVGNMATGASGSGGGILNRGGALSITASTIEGNSAARAGGGIEDDATQSGTLVTLDNVTLAGNTAGANPGNGGGLHLTGPGSVTITGGAITGNTAAAEGGGLWNSSNGMLTVTGVTLDGNTAAGNGANQGGGGIFSNGGSTTIVRSTLSGNRATGAAGNGGGVHIAAGMATLTNTTLSGNGAVSGSGGGLAASGGMVSLEHVTVAMNQAADGGGGVANAGGTIDLRNTIVARNTASSGNDLSGTIASGDYNLIGETAGATISGSTGNSLLNVNPRLSGLQNNGGGTLTHLPLLMSPAIDAGFDAGVTVDQRGVARPQNGQVDIGAVEVAADGSGPGGSQDAMLDGEGNLIVVGSGQIEVFASNGALYVRMNNVVSGPFDVTGRIMITGGPGFDYIVLAGRIEVGADIFGGDGNDYIAGNLGDDTIFGGGGNDTLFGNHGDNYLDGGEGNDRLEAGNGDDTLFGGPGNDLLAGQQGNDYLDGGDGNDMLTGGDDNDFIRGGDGSDTATGDWGDDIVLGEAGSDQLFGRQGFDLVIGGAGTDRVRTDEQSDIVIGNQTNLDDDEAALRAVLAYWTSGGSFAQLASDIVAGAGGVPQLLSVEDGAPDELIGDTDPDLYYATLDDFIRNLRDEDIVVS